jgi:hypothetical protein
MAELVGARAQIAGDVYGDIVADPETIDLGKVATWQDASAKVVFTGPGISAATMKVSTDSRYFNTKFVDLGATADGTGNRVELDVTGTEALPPGGLNSQIVVVTSKGIRYSLPASVTITKAATTMAAH